MFHPCKEMHSFSKVGNGVAYMEHQSHLGIRKGAWTVEEDNLLRKCIETNGEGKWHQVPQKAGLNRCRKSCRLRWLNYLKPTIKRGEFADDEIDLMKKLHKLLGNRWALISGRLPGRTANDVKNFWNSHLRKNATYYDDYYCSKSKEKPHKSKKTKAIKPRPWSFSGRQNPLPPPPPPPQPLENEIPWWEDLLQEKDVEQGIIGAPNFYGEDKETSESGGIIEDGSSTWADLSFDVDFWNL